MTCGAREQIPQLGNFCVMLAMPFRDLLGDAVFKRLALGPGDSSARDLVEVRQQLRQPVSLCLAGIERSERRERALHCDEAGRVDLRDRRGMASVPNPSSLDRK